MAASRPALLLSAPASNQGKTLVSAALARAWRNQGLTVQAFKCGPDFLDPMILHTATGRPVYNLDLAMCGADDIAARLYQAAQQADVVLVEGVMGLYDGSPSSADIAARFQLPVALAIDASGMAQTFGALAAGLFAHRPELIPAGVIANRTGSAGHGVLLRDSLPPDIPWLGALQKQETLALPERHLGLFRADEIDGLEQRIAQAAALLTESGALPLPPETVFAPLPPANDVQRLLAGKTIAVARDEAFCFIYPANLDCLHALGADTIFFSPLHDEALPAGIDAVWLPGGYPELHLATLGGNHAMRAALQQAWRQGLPILAECGGMMAVANNIDRQPGFGLLPGDCSMQPRFQGLGVQFAELPEGRLHAHTFHYSRLDTALPIYAQATTQRGKPGEAVYRHGRLTASYLHFYFPSNPSAVARLFSE
ncbi:cobyrinate a,c-diamide synthase [Methylobacillus flagellatus]|uniref:cobyrinate a,c-diamide synthase n=1 Tax=Methylobacillus flagellatus TaxID=405 RepID=UPI002853AA45|nr:cobyrinate a,c-diamide synthase [Methylobacillus flagellatus]MDR5172833.1 cobyrinate a,c-diamide synthase [Methylobacillus flagellatus]